MRQGWASRGLRGALCLALVVAQLAGFALTAQAAAAPLDLFGNPICAPHADTGSRPAQTPAHLPLCCQLGCLMAGGALGPSSPGASLPAPRLVALGSATPSLTLAPARVPDAWHPGNPRAPPALAQPPSRQADR